MQSRLASHASVTGEEDGKSSRRVRQVNSTDLASILLKTAGVINTIHIRAGLQCSLSRPFVFWTIHMLCAWASKVCLLISASQPQASTLFSNGACC